MGRENDLSILERIPIFKAMCAEGAQPFGLRYDCIVKLNRKVGCKNMGKILLFVAAGILVWLLIKGLGKKAGTSAKNDAAHRKNEGPELMVKCDLCGVFMPESESAQEDGKKTCRTPKQCLHRQSA